MNQPQIVISCGAQKLEHAAPAGELYTGPLFRAQLKFALHFYSSDKVLILSAKHGLVRLSQQISPYDVRVTDAGAISYEALAAQLDPHFFSVPPIHFLGSNEYRRLFLDAWRERYSYIAMCRCEQLMECPLEGMGTGQRIGFLCRAVAEGVAT